MKRLLTLLALVIVAGCASNTDAPVMEAPAVITGTVTYRERILPPPGSEVHVVLLDVSKMDVLATTIAETRFPAESGPPFNFSLSYDEGQIKAGMRYSLRATIKREDTLLFTSVTALNPFLQPDSEIEILVQSVGRR